MAAAAGTQLAPVGVPEETRLSTRDFPSEQVLPLFDMTDAERDERSGDEWILSAISYCETRGGFKWRKLHVSGQRVHRLRVHYLGAIRLLNDRRYETEPLCRCKWCAETSAAKEAAQDRFCADMAAAVALTIPRKPVSRHLPSLDQLSKLKAGAL